MNLGSAKNLKRALKAAEAEWQKADAELDAAKDALREAEGKMRDEFEERLRNSLGAERARLAAARAEEQSALVVLETVKVAQAAELGSHGFREGQKVVEWSNTSRYYSSQPVPYTKTGRSGVVRIWTRASDFPANLRWGLPSVGDLYVRVVKKDGTASLTFDKLNNYRQSWFVEGVDPNKAAGK